jgi:group I intron endonuclease
MSISGIYAITHRATNRHYVGSSTHVMRRLMNHRTLLRRGAHENPRLQFAWNKHGEVSFDFDLLEEVDEVNLLASEQRYLDAFFEQLYNLSRVAGKPPSPRGVPKSPEHRAKIAEGNRGKVFTEERRANLSAAQARRMADPARRVKQGLTRKGVPLSPEHRAKVAGVWKGRRHTPESRAKIRASALGHGCSAETRAKIGAATRARSKKAA